MLILLACVLFILPTSFGVEGVGNEKYILGPKKTSALEFEKFPFNGKIVGGQRTTIEAYPYQVLIRLYNSSNHLSTCGGSIISEQWILSAAHCLFNKVKGDVRAGSTYPRKGGVTVPVFMFLTPENYVHGTFNIDVGLILLQYRLNLSTPRMRRIELSEPGLELAEGVQTIVTGWGTTYQSNKSSEILMVVAVPIVRREVCQMSYPQKMVSMNMICAGRLEGGVDSCKGDSGGPMVYNNVQVGIVSWGVGCGVAGKPGVYANIAAVRNWIRINSGV